MWIIAVLGLAGFWLWRSNKRRAQRFVRAVCFLDIVDGGANANEANGQIARLFSKHSTPQADDTATAFAIDKAQQLTEGKQLPWIHEARKKGFVVDSGNTKLDMAHVGKSIELGERVGLAVKNEITFPFTSNLVPVPERLFLDPYVAGFASHLLKSYGVSAGALQLSSDQLGSFFDVATRTMIGPQFLTEYASLAHEDESFVCGSRDAALYSIAMLKPSSLDGSDVLVKKATELAKTRIGLTNEVGQFTELASEPEGDARQVAMIWAMKSLTLGRHLERNYGVET